VSAGEAFDRPDGVLNSLAALGDPAVTEDVEGRGGGAGVEGVENRRVHAARGAMAGEAVSSPEVVADPPGISQKAVGPADDVPLELMPLEDEVEEFGPGAEAVELRERRILARQSDVEGLVGEGRIRASYAEEGKPGGRLARGMEQGEGVAAADEFVPDFDITADSPENFDVGKDGGDVHKPDSIR